MFHDMESLCIRELLLKYFECTPARVYKKESFCKNYGIFQFLIQYVKPNFLRDKKFRDQENL